MKIPTIFTVSVAALSIISLGNGFFPAEAAANETVQVTGAWVRAMPAASKKSAAYLVIDNPTGKDEELLSAATNISSLATIHTTRKKEGMMEMVAVDSVVVPAGGQIKLEPGGYHLMLTGLKRGPSEGDLVKIMLKFKHAGRITITAPVRVGRLLDHMMKKGRESGGKMEMPKEGQHK